MERGEDKSADENFYGCKITQKEKNKRKQNKNSVQSKLKQATHVLFSHLHVKHKWQR